ncbi:sensor histidine kinase [Jatrophihabitans sp. YIM 134969]
MTDLAERPATAPVPATAPAPAPAGPAPALVAADRPPIRSARRGISLRRSTNWGFALFTLVKLAAVAGIAVALAALTSAVDAQNDHIGPAVIRASNINAALLDQETGARGYALSGDNSYLQPYSDGLVAMGTAVAQLRGYLRPADTAAAAELTELLAAADTWRSDFAEPLIDATRAGDREAVQELLRGPNTRGKELFDDVRARYASLSAVLVAARTEAVDQVHSAVQWLIVAVAVGFGVVVVASTAVFAGIRRRVITPLFRIAAASRRVSDGDLAHEVTGGGPAEIDDVARDVEAMRRRIVGELAEVENARTRLELSAASLARSNADLEQFAYVASHDLQEPLRKVSNFCQLLERQYGEQLDDRAGQYIHFAVDGAKRMQALINDLLSFSRVGRNTDSFVDVPLADVVREALDNLAGPLQETGGLVDVAPDLPTVPGDRTLLVTLVQNLVGNALKYHGEQVPRVEITAERRLMNQPAGVDAPPRHEWVIGVADNGIGIEPQYAQRIFVIFQRLHLRDSYGGTGIGLAVSKKIVEFHGGTIWLDPPGSGTGARFCFTLPEGTTP